MKPLSFKRHRFPAAIIRQAVWLYFRFSLSLRDVEELMAARGIDVSYETIRCWTIKFGPQIARRLKMLRPSPSPRWHLDEVVCSIGGKRMFLWRAVDDEGEVLDVVVQRRRDTDAALRLLRRLLRNQPIEPEKIVTDGARIIPGSFRPDRPASPACPRPAARKQSSGELPPADTPAGATAAAVQISGFSPAFPHHSRRNLQHLLRSTTSHQPTKPPPFPRQSECGMGRRGRLRFRPAGQVAVLLD